ncbi:dihydrofolate reductase family protein [Streptomyces sp. VRA16 Mangrove soil]|uniref:dihydrofolate reductase family protein n=1 Tax=Streptomyces sp. VRA16 Mangrove soil TaxID=2817434 RepID=UPI001A9CBE49|nr:dihydrofolate reductase family protein [Streptomyces sp. VRA16 Mangrove soil]MBO1331262.1 dihydrofolate reductase family protein [Streptomyces sp. VRA16 Mangrove soil]
MKLTLTQFLSIDGVHQAPGAPEEDTSGGFPHGGWTVPFGDEDFMGFVTESFARADAFLLGRRTYDIFAGYWPRRTDPADPVASKLNALPKYVASRTLTGADWAGTRVIGGSDLVKDVTALKEQPGRELQIHGSGDLAAYLLRHDLIDTLHLLTFPVVLGTGKRLFAEGAVATAFRNAGTRVTGKGVVITSYELDGRPTYGSFA